jgi:intraflagellar transport protein 140
VPLAFLCALFPSHFGAGRIALVDRFVLARKLAKTDTAKMVEVCVQLLEQRDAEPAIRVGDVFALLVYFNAQQKDWGKAHMYIEGMRARGIPVDPYIDAPLVNNIYRQVGKEPPQASPDGKSNREEIEEKLEH